MRRKKIADRAVKIGDTIYIPAKVVNIVQNGGQHPWKCYHAQYAINETTIDVRLVKSEFVEQP